MSRAEEKREKIKKQTRERVHKYRQRKINSTQEQASEVALIPIMGGGSMNHMSKKHATDKAKN